MARSELTERLLGGRMTRREFHRRMAAAGLGFAAVPLAAPRARAAAPELTVFEWSGYDVPEMHPAFVAKYGASPNFSLFSTEEEALQKLLAGFVVDLMHPCSYNIKRWRDAGVLKPIDVSRLSHYENVWERFRTIPETSFDGQAYFVPFDAGLSSILYRTDLVDPADVADPSWALLFNEKYKGRLSMYDTDTTLIEIATRIKGWYGEYLALPDDKLAEVKKVLVAQRDLMRFYWSDQTQLEQAMASGEVVAAYAWNGSYSNLKKQGLSVAYMVPKEGVLSWCCGMVRHAQAPGDDTATYDFLDAMLDPEAGKGLMAAGYFHSNRKTYDLIEPQVLADMGVADPETTFAALEIGPEPEEPHRTKYISLVNEVKSGT